MQYKTIINLIITHQLPILLSQTEHRHLYFSRECSTNQLFLCKTNPIFALLTPKTAITMKNKTKTNPIQTQYNPKKSQNKPNQTQKSKNPEKTKKR